MCWNRLDFHVLPEVSDLKISWVRKVVFKTVKYWSPSLYVYFLVFLPTVTQKPEKAENSNLLLSLGAIRRCNYKVLLKIDQSEVHPTLFLHHFEIKWFNNNN